MKTLGDRIVTVLLVLFCLVYVAYQVYQYYFSPYASEAVLEFTVSDTIYTEGIAIRDEVIIAQPEDGTVRLLYDDATKLIAGRTVAELVGDGYIDYTWQIREIDKEIAMLREAQNTNIGPSQTNVINAEVRQQLLHLVSLSHTGDFQSLGSTKDNLTELLNKRSISTNKETNFDVRIEQLTAERDSLALKMETVRTERIAAPKTGYFAQGMDGYESFNSKTLIDSDASDIRSLISNTESYSSDPMVLGRMVLSQNWYFAAVIQESQLGKFTAGAQINLDFGLAGQGPVRAVVYKVAEGKNGKDGAVIFRCDQLSGQLINLRHSSVRIDFAQYDGLWISSSYIRFDEQNRKGVYILIDNIVRFRTVDPIYEEEGFLLSNIQSADENAVKKYDQVLVKGIDLYDGKIIKK